MRNPKQILAGTALSTIMATPIAVSAQQTTTQVIDEIVVTAQKREQRLIDVPAAVTAIGEETLTRHNLTRIEEFAAHTPGLNFNQAGAGLLLTVRGLNASGQGATTAILVNDVPLTSASSYQQATTPNFFTYDLERVEVLRGPQGTLYGASALGGLVKYVTKSPDLSRFEATSQLELNHVDEGETAGAARAAVNIPLVTDALALRVSGVYERLPGYIDNVLGNEPDVNHGKRYGGRASLLWQANSDLTVELGAIWQRDDRNALALAELNGAVFTPAAPPANAISIANAGDLQQNSRVALPVVHDTEVYSATLNYDANFATIRSVTSYAKAGYDQFRNDGDQVAFPGVTYGGYLSQVYGQPVDIRSHNVTSVRRFNQEIRIGSAPNTTIFGVPMDYLVGAFYADEESRLTQIFDVLSATRPPQVLSVPFPGGGIDIPARYEELAGFGQLTWHVTPSVDVTAGGRYSHNRQRTQTTKHAGFVSGSPVDIVDPPSRDSDDEVTWSAAINWHPIDAINLYSRVATGYRPGGPNATPPLTPAGFLTRYDPDTTVNYELGAKGELFDRRAAFDVSVFTIDWSDIQVPTSTVDPDTGVPFNYTANAGEARSRGIEYAFRLMPIDWLSLSVSGAYTDAELRADAPTTGGRNGDELPYVPDFTNTVSVDYHAAVSARADLLAGVDWTYTGARYSDFVPGGVAAPNTNHQRLPSYNTVNLRGGIDFGSYQLDVYVANVGNERGLYYYGSGGGANGTGLGLIQQLRTFGVRFSSEF